MTKLSSKYQQRLEEWKKRTSGTPIEQKPKQTQKNHYVGRADYGDDIRDYEAKDMAAWRQEFMNNPMYQGYR